MAKNTEQAKRLSKARTLLLLDQPFFGTLAMRMPLVEDRSIETACTNGEVLYYNPDWVATLSDAEIRGMLAHEVMHPANGHTWRRCGRNPEQWNVAADYAINPYVLAAGMQLPGKALVNPAYNGMAAEAIYAKLPPPPPGGGGAGDGKGQGAGQAEGDGEGQGDGEGEGTGKPGKGKGRGKGGRGKGQPGTDPGGCGGVMDAPAGTGHAQQAEWQVAVAQAAMAAKSQGNLPGGLAELVNDIMNPQVPWETVLRDFVTRTAKNDYNWARPNRRYLSQGVVLPGLVSDELPAIVVAVDTSGSISSEELAKFQAEVSAVLGCFDTTIHVLHVDAQVAEHQEVTRADLPLNLTWKGRGGTSFKPAFEWVDAQGLEPACMVYLTDLYGDFPAVEPPYPVLWVCTTDPTRHNVPFGETVKIN